MNQPTNIQYARYTETMPDSHARQEIQTGDTPFLVCFSTAIFLVFAFVLTCIILNLKH